MPSPIRPQKPCEVNRTQVLTTVTGAEIEAQTSYDFPTRQSWGSPSRHCPYPNFTDNDAEVKEF